LKKDKKNLLFIIVFIILQDKFSSFFETVSLPKEKRNYLEKKTA